MKKNLFALLAVVTLAGSLAGCNPSTSGSGTGTGGKEYPDYEEQAVTPITPTLSNGGSIVNIRCWNTEFEERFAQFYDGIDEEVNPKKFVKDKGNLATASADGTYTLKNFKTASGDKIKVKFIVNANQDNGYQIPLDRDLKNQATASADNKIDMFLMEADYALKYANSDYSVDISKLGITENDTKDMYDYTKVIATDTRKGMNNALKGLSWQAAPGLFAYRNDFAKKLWSDYPADPAESDTQEVKAQKTAAQAEFVQGKIGTWDKFNAVAKEAKEKNIHMLSGFDDSYRTFSNSAKSSWIKKYVNVDGEKTAMLTLDPEIKNWIKQTKEYTDKKYNNQTSLWDDNWAKGQSIKGDVFGYFYSTWGINFTLLGNAGDELYGQYRVCQGPASYYWGGTWLCAANYTDNADVVKDIMLKLTCNKDVAKSITSNEIVQDYTNNKTAMHELATDKNYGSKFLGGQNHIALFEKSASNLKMAAMSAIDQTCNEGIQNAMKDYFTGKISYKEAVNNFKKNCQDKVNSILFDSTFDEEL